MTATAVRDGKSASISPGEFHFTDKDFDEIASLIKEIAGIHLLESKKSLVYSRLAKRLRAIGLKSFSDYCDLIRSDEGQEEKSEMLNALTTNVTRFFREPHHFEILKTTILPPLIERAKQGGRVRIWSSACSSGEEPYTIAVTILSILPDAHRYDLKVLATDIDENIIAKAKMGIYRSQLIEPVPGPMLKRYFTRSGDDYVVNDEVKKLISFRPLNLIHAWPMQGAFDAIFCRNVVIYFDRETQQSLWQRFARAIQPEGWLMIGHSERITGPAASQFEPQGFTAFRKIS